MWNAEHGPLFGDHMPVRAAVSTINAQAPCHQHIHYISCYLYLLSLFFLLQSLSFQVLTLRNCTPLT